MEKHQGTNVIGRRNMKDTTVIGKILQL
jgi:hypothetical protein